MYPLFVALVLATGAVVLVTGRIRLRDSRAARTKLVIGVFMGAFGALVAYSLVQADWRRAEVLSIIGGAHVAVVSLAAVVWPWFSR
ncbi:MAG: hypothetical protein Q8P22_07475 [Chloroflexota bacterium]|nr:hypothetical protein [Chloroflexota bacterium]